MYIALTGTPGTGKTSAAKILAERGHIIKTVLELAEQYNATETVDGEVEIDTEKLFGALGEIDEIIIIEGHLAHLLPNGLCIILRSHPEILRKRLAERKYSNEKVMENLEAEAIDIILTEALEACEIVCELDTSELTAEKTAEAIERIMNGEADKYPPGKIDWSGAVMDWY
ncbi:MAG: adenylate kinase family protein [Thermoplasmata archaeon]|nr:adenylate kinase family protein [Thermoplasmata archaeon]